MASTYRVFTASAEETKTTTSYANETKPKNRTSDKALDCIKITSKSKTSTTTKTKKRTTTTTSSTTKATKSTSGKKYYTEEDVIVLAKVLYRECGGVPSETERACVAWVACNRVDAGFGSTITAVLTAPNQFAYYSNTVVRSDLKALAEDVLTRWSNEKNGQKDVGRVLPKQYLYFSGDGSHNYFRDSNGNVWNYSLPSPYSS